MWLVDDPATNRDACNSVECDVGAYNRNNCCSAVVKVNYKVRALPLSAIIAQSFLAKKRQMGERWRKSSLREKRK